MRTIVIVLLMCACGYSQENRRQNFNNDQQNPTYPNPYRQSPPKYEYENPENYHSPAPIHVPDVKIAVTPIPIIRLNKQQSLDGSYKSSYETGNSIIAEETGFVKNLGIKGSEGLVQYGSYSYTDPDGKVISVRYTADEGGFRPEGDHLPTPPPVPLEIQKGLDIIFESIRQQAEKESQEKQVHNTRLESANYPETREDDGSYRPEYN